MSFRNTTLMFGLLLGMLWIFGLMLAIRPTAAGEQFLLPTLHELQDIKIDTLTIEQPGKFPETYELKDAGDLWSLHAGGQSTRIERFRITELINQIKEAKAAEGAEVRSDLAFHGLDKANRKTITLSGHSYRKKATKAAGKDKAKHKDPDLDLELDEKTEQIKGARQEWKLYLGKESADKAFIYANSSERPGRVFAVDRQNVRSLAFDDPNTFRSRLLFTFDEPAARVLTLAEGKNEVSFEKIKDEAAWRFLKPAYGYVDFEGPPVPKELPPGIKIPETGLKALLGSLRQISVKEDSDFVPLGLGAAAEFGLEEGKETMRIEVRYEEGRDKKDLSKEVLLVGKPAGPDQVYARMANDPGIFKLNVSLLEQVQRALKNPGELRNRDLIHFDVKSTDQVALKAQGEEIKLSHPALKPWEVQSGAGKPSKANEKMVQTLLDAVQGKRTVKEFQDKLDFKPEVEVRLFMDSLKEEPKADKKEEKKDEKKDDKKDPKKEEKKEAKPAVTLLFGPVDKDKKLVPVQRVLPDGTTSYFQVDAALLDRIAPARAGLAFLDLDLPEFTLSDVARLEMQRDGRKFDVVKGQGDDAERWWIEDAKEPAGRVLADTNRTANLLNNLGNLRPNKWLARADKADLDKMGLKTPALTVNVVLRKNKIDAEGAARALGMVSAPIPVASLLAGLTLRAAQHADKGETVALSLGKTADEKDGQGIYALHSKKDLIFLLPEDYLKYLRETDLKDRSGFLTTQPVVNTGLVGAIVGNPKNALWIASPITGGRLHLFDPANVQSIRLAIRTQELRTFAFQRDAKDKDWKDQSNLVEFTLDAAKVNAFLDQLAQLKGERLAGIARPAADQKLTAKDAAMKVDLLMTGGQTLSVTIGAVYDRGGLYFVQTSALPGLTFLAPPHQIDLWLRGVGYFAKDRVAGL